jgi:predicted transcriptional regulator
MRVGGRGRKADTVAIGFRIPAELDRALRAMAQDQGLTPGAVIENLIKKEIERETQER